MGDLDKTIHWLRRLHKNAVKALEDLKSGQRIEFQGNDVTDQWTSRYERLIERYERLIAKYEQRDRETSLTESLRFRE